MTFLIVRPTGESFASEHCLRWGLEIPDRVDADRVLEEARDPGSKSRDPLIEQVRMIHAHIENPSAEQVESIIEQWEAIQDLMEKPR